MPIKPLTGSELSQLAESGEPRESCGPLSGRPAIVLTLKDADDRHKDWLKSLPCPTIGLGSGPLEEHCDIVLTDDAQLPLILSNIAHAPFSAMILVQHLRASENLHIQDALTAESFAYAAVQKGPEFLDWHRHNRGKDSKSIPTSEPLLVAANGPQLQLTLNDPDNHNMMGVTMRDALCEALDLALTDESFETIKLTAKGRSFSQGGDLSEFGQAPDPATAHWIRSLRLPAWRLARLRQKLHVHVHGAAIGAGAEIACFAAHITASENAWFQLPELQYGLIPGAGGTASISRRIGRKKTAYMALSMKRITAQMAHNWGLIDEIVS